MANPLSEFLFGRLSTPAGRVAAVQASRAGLRHDFATEPLDPAPDVPVRVSVYVGADLGVRSVFLACTTDGREPVLPDPAGQGSGVLFLKWSRVEWDTLVWGYVEEWTATLPGFPDGTMVRYAIAAEGTDGRRIACTSGNPGDTPRIFGFHVDRERIPVWLHDAVIYQILPDRFAPDPGRPFESGRGLAEVQGGTLRGLTSRLDDLAGLGVNCLWLTPVMSSPSYHGYDPTDLAAVEPRLGTEADWAALVDGAHRRGLRILLDCVANHCSEQHPWFREARRDAASPYREWFQFMHWPDQYRCFLDLPGLPAWNTSHPAVREYLIGQALRWLERGCDGFRLDHAQGPGPLFWSEFRARVRAVRPDCVLLGEVTEPPDVLRTYQGRMDGCLDFALAELLRGFFAFDRVGVGQFVATIERHFAYFGDGLVLPGFLDNHDMSRFFWAVRGDQRRLRLAALCLFTLPGPPIIYYGTEVGLSQQAELVTLEEARLPMPWDDRQDRALATFFRDLIRLRREGGEAWRAGRRVVAVDEERRLLVYTCGPYVVGLNNGPAVAEVPLGDLKLSALVLVTDATTVRWAGGPSLVLPPYEGAVLC